MSAAHGSGEEMEDREFLVCGFEGTWYLQYNTAQWLSWLERRPVTAEVESSSLFWVVYGVLAQLGEHLPYKQRVIGSSPIGPITWMDSRVAKGGRL